MKRQSFAPRQAANLKLSTEGSGRLASSNTTSSPNTAAATAAKTTSSNSSSASSSGNGAAKPPFSQATSPAEVGVSASHLHPRTFSSDSGSHYQQQQLEAALESQGSGGVSSSSIQSQLQQLRAHHAGLMRLGLLMALTM